MSRLAVALGLLIGASSGTAASPGAPLPATPIKHLVIVFQENRSFDAYFATYPHALDPPGQPAFHPRPTSVTWGCDRIAGSLDDMFDFGKRRMRKLILDPATGLRAPRGR